MRQSLSHSPRHQNRNQRSHNQQHNQGKHGEKDLNENKCQSGTRKSFRFNQRLKQVLQQCIIKLIKAAPLLALASYSSGDCAGRWPLKHGQGGLDVSERWARGWHSNKPANVYTFRQAACSTPLPHVTTVDAAPAASPHNAPNPEHLMWTLQLWLDYVHSTHYTLSSTLEGPRQCLEVLAFMLPPTHK